MKTTGKMLALVVFVWIVDQFSKSWAESAFAAGRGEIIGGIELRSLENPGVLGGHFAYLGPWIIALILLSIILLLAYFFFNIDFPLIWLPIGLFIGGTVANLTDRLSRGAVYDFIGAHPAFVFNLADLFIISGALLLAPIAVLGVFKRFSDAPGA